MTADIRPEYRFESRYVTETTHQTLLAMARACGGYDSSHRRRLRLFGYVMLTPMRRGEKDFFFGNSVVDAIYARPGKTKNQTAKALVTELEEAFGVKIRLHGWQMPKEGIPGSSWRFYLNEIPAGIQRLMEDDLRSGERLVDLVTGEPIDRAAVEAHRISLATRRSNANARPEVLHFVKRLNDLPLEEFLPLLRGLPEAIAETMKIEDAAVQRNTLTLLSRIRAFPKPIYAAATGSDRAFPVVAAFHYLPTRVRECLTQAHPDWAEYDMQKAQLRIYSAEPICDVPEIRRALASGDLWNDLLASIGMKGGDKRIAKEASYGSLYGSTERQTRHRLLIALCRDLRRRYENLPSEAVASVDNTMNSPFLKAVFDGSEKALSLLAGGGTMNDAWGEALGIDLTPPNGKSKLGKALRQKRARQLFARVIQSYEVRCMTAAGELMIAWIHDGCWCRKDDRERVEALVESEANALGLPEYNCVTGQSSDLDRDQTSGDLGSGTYNRSLNPQISGPARILGILGAAGGEGELSVEGMHFEEEMHFEHQWTDEPLSFDWESTAA